MNCKPGDLAVIVNCVYYPEHNGMLVEVIACTTGDRWVAPDGLLWRDPEGATNPAYGVKSLGSALEWALRVETQFGWFSSHCVRPIRDNDGEDEMLRIAGHPNKVAA